MPRVLQWAANFTLVSLGWVLFVFDLRETGQFFSSLAGMSPSAVTDPTPAMWTVLGIAAAVCFAPKTEELMQNRFISVQGAALRNAAFAVMIMFVLMFMDRSGTFIYFRF